jgi:UDP-glucuronate 4-epimerase
LTKKYQIYGIGAALVDTEVVVTDAFLNTNKIDIGNNQPVELMDYIGAIENALGKTATKELLPLQAGDMLDTYANVDDLVEQFHYKPATTVNDGIQRFAAWYREFYGLVMP